MLGGLITWTIGAVLAVVAFFIWQGFRTRCPMCGHMALHSKDRVAEEKQREYRENLKKTGMLEALDSAGSGFGTERSRPGYVNAKFRCKKCDWSFDRHAAVTWLTTANKLGEQRALDEYRKLQEEKCI